MSYDEEQARKSRVVVETPNSRREVEQSESLRAPERSGVSATTVGILVVLVVALVTILVLLLMNNQSTDMTNLAAQQPTPLPQTTVIEQPAQQQPPIIIQQPAPVSQPAPIIVTQPAPTGGTASSGTDDATIQAAIDKKFADDPNLASLAIITTVLNGKATITGTVKSESLKSQIEQSIRVVKGVKEVDNQIVVTN
jgi:uncharacterized integral membrane protein